MSFVLIGVGVLVMLEIFLTAALLWLYFKLDELQPRLKAKFRGCQAVLSDKCALLTSVEGILDSTTHIQAKAIGKWSMFLKTAVTILEKLALAAK